MGGGFKMNVYSGVHGGNHPLPNSPYGFELFSRRACDCSLSWRGENDRGGVSFKVAWQDADQFLGRVGLFWDEGKPFSYYGNIFCDFDFSKEPEGLPPEYSYVWVYGWTKSPLIEWNIVEDRFGEGLVPLPLTSGNFGPGAEEVGRFFLDGSDYVAFRSVRPSTAGNIEDSHRPFLQYFSVRQSPRHSGTISVTEHFKAWEGFGMKLGTNMYESKFFVEVASGGGQLDVSHVLFRLEKA